jgi:hypothetical protein
MGHASVVHEAEDRAAEREEKIQIRQFGPDHQRNGRRGAVPLLEAGLGQQRAGQAMGEIICHPFLFVPHTVNAPMVCDRMRGAPWPAQ